MFIFRIIGIIFALMLTGAAVLAVIYTSTMWAVILAVVAITVWVLSLTRRKKAIAE